MDPIGPAPAPRESAHEEDVKREEKRRQSGQFKQFLTPAQQGAAPPPPPPSLPKAKAPAAKTAAPAQAPKQQGSTQKTQAAPEHAAPNPDAADDATQAAKPRMHDQPILSRAAAQLLSQVDHAAMREQTEQTGKTGKAGAQPADSAIPEVSRREEAGKSSSGHSDSSSGDQTGGSGLGAPIPGQPLAQGAAAPGRATIVIPPNIQQFIEFAAVQRTMQGTVEFRIGLSRELGGASIHLAAYGNRRLGVRVRTGGNRSAISDEDLQSLLDSIRNKGVDIVDVVVE